MLALDTTSGAFAGFFQPLPVRQLQAGRQLDVDVPAGPMHFHSRRTTQVLGIGSKNGSFFMLNPATMGVIARRQLLPYDSGGNPFT